MSDTFCSICCIDYYSVYLLVYMSFVTLCDASPHIINPLEASSCREEGSLYIVPQVLTSVVPFGLNGVI